MDSKTHLALLPSPLRSRVLTRAKASPVPVRPGEEGLAGHLLPPRDRQYHPRRAKRAWWRLGSGNARGRGAERAGRLPGGGAGRAGRGADGTTGAGWGGNGTGATMAR